jgi:hypothetical protein
VKFRNHQAEWNVSETEVEETSSTVRRRAAATEAKWLTEPSLALWFSSTLAQRSVHCRHFYKFKLAARWAALDPMDYVSLTEPTTGLDAVLCRIVSIKRNADGSLDVEALETPQGVATPVDLTPQAHDGFDSYTPQPTYPATQAGVDTAQAAAEAAQADADTALADLSHIGADGWLSKGEKPQVVIDWNALWSEWSTATTGLAARAEALGVSTTTYSAKLNALSTYLTTAFNATTGEGLGTGGGDYANSATDSQINAATWRTRWEEAQIERGKLVAALSEPTILGMAAFARTGYGDADRVWYRGNSFGAPVLMDPTWSSAKAYAVGNRVLYSGNVYRCILARSATATAPTSDAAHWTLIGTVASQERILIQAMAPVVNLPGSATWAKYKWWIGLRPRDLRDNLDAIRYCHVVFFDSAGAIVEESALYLPERKYQTPGTDDAVGNEVGTSLTEIFSSTMRYASGNQTFNGYLKVSIQSCFGAATRYFNGGDATWTPYAGGVSIPTQPAVPPPVEPEDSGGKCVAPETLITMAGGTRKAAGSVVVGEEVWARHEKTGEWGAFPVSHHSIHVAERVRVRTTDGRALVCSDPHRLAASIGWTGADALPAGMQIDGTEPGVVAVVERATRGPVVQMTVVDAHTYVAEGLLSHNVKIR